MPVTVETPWLNCSGGSTTRNGTTTQSISFGWTPQRASLLVVFLFGAVNHTVSTGEWTKRIQVQGWGEMCMLTTHANGHTGITDVINGLNYLVGWVAFEFPPGAVYLTGIGSGPTTDTFPALSGLPASESVILAVLGHNSNSVVATSFSAAWSAPWVEDADFFTPYDVNEGHGMTVAHRINSTAASVTPATTVTRGGTWTGVPDRGLIVAAFDMPSTATPTPAEGARNKSAMAAMRGRSYG